MAMPNENTLTKIDYSPEFLSPDDRQYSPLVDYEIGGFDIGNTAAGLRFQAWECFYDGNSIKLRAEISGSVTTLVSDLNDVTEVAIGFDRNMNPVYAYTRSDPNTAGLYLNFFDTSVNTRVVVSLGDGRNPRICHDDTRDASSNLSDVLVTYIRNDDQMVCQRIQRDRYEIIYPLIQTDRSKRLVQVGMTKSNRIGIKLSEGNDYTFPEPDKIYRYRFLANDDGNLIATDENLLIED